MKQKTPEELLRIEALLNTVTFSGIPIGGLTTDFLYLDLFHKGAEPTPLKTRILDSIVIFKRFLGYFPAVLRKAKPYTGPRHPAVIGYSLNKERFLGFFGDMVTAWKETGVVLTSYRKWNIEIPGTEFREIGDPDIFQYLKWMRLYLPMRSRLFSVYRKLRKEFGFDSNAIHYLHAYVTYQTLQIIWFREELKRIEPRLVIVEFDRKMNNSGLVLAARSMGIPTFTLVHGSTEPITNYVPVLAENIICWGHPQRRQFEAAGMRADHIGVCGNPNLPEPPAAMKPVKGNLTLVLASNNMPVSDSLALHAAFEQGTADVPGISCAQKLHPSEEKERYSAHSRKSHVTLYASDEMTLSTLFETCDLLVAHNSAVILEAIGNGIPVLILNLPEITYPAGIGQLLFEMPGYPRVTSSEELAAYIRAITADHSELDHLYQLCRTFLNGYCSAYGSDAAEHSAAFIRSKVMANP